MEDHLSFGLVQVDGDGFLIAIGDLEHQTAPIGELLRLTKHGPRPTREISLSWFFYFDDLCPQIRQHHGGERPLNPNRQIEHPNPFERHTYRLFHVFLLYRRQHDTAPCHTTLEK